MIKIIDTGKKSALANMEEDRKLLEELNPKGLPILHFYDWEHESITYGHFVLPEKYLNLKSLADNKISMAKRPTGGGIVFHIWDFAFSILIPSGHKYFFKETLANYQFVNKVVLRAVKELLDKKNSIGLTDTDFSAVDENCNFFCMARPTKYDVILNNQKIAGAAQRRTKNGYLHQGTISIAPPCKLLLSKILLKDSKVLDAILAHSYPILNDNSSKKDLEKVKEDLKVLLKNHFQKEMA